MYSAVIKSILILLILVVPVRVLDAQTAITSEEIRQKEERDKSITADKLSRVKIEAVSVQDSILELMKEKFRKFDLVSNHLYGPETGGLGGRGQMVLESQWKKGKARFDLTVAFVFSPEEAQTFHLKQLKGVSMGEGFRGPEPFGSDAVIVKNVQFNKAMRWVTLYFWKGRLRVNASYDNAFSPNTPNEKELLEIINAIYPLLVAKENFEDV